MKTYSINPGDDFVSVTVGKRKRRMPAQGPIDWGNSGPGATTLAIAILTDVLGSEMEARKLAQRFKWRTIATWPKGAPASISEDEVRGTVADIMDTAKEAAPFVRKVAGERAPIVTDRGAPGQKWEKNPDIVVNKPPEPKP
jgi:hypothetical protein